MKVSPLLALAALSLSSASFGVGQFPFLANGNMNEIVPGQVLVKYTQAAADRIVANPILKSLPASTGFPGARYLNRIGNSGWILWEVPKGTDVKQLASQVQRTNDVIMAQPVNKIYPLLTIPNDGDYGVIENSEDLIFNSGEDIHEFMRLWHLDDTFAMAGWSIWPNRWYTAATKPRNAVSLAIIDTGCDMTHPDFANVGNPSTDAAQGGQLDIANSRQFRLGGVDPTGSPEDAHGHGTHVAGLAVAAGNNGSFNGHGVIGTGYPAKAMILRVFDTSGNGSDSDAAAAIFWAADKGAAVINLSLGTTNYSQLFQDAVTYAFQKGTLVICAGNENGNGGGDLGPIYPAACSGAFAVTANGPDFVPATTNYTGTGYYMSMAAPGGDVVFGSDFSWFKIQYDFSLSPRGGGALNSAELNPPFTLDYSYLVGTSMACPVVSGAATLWYGRFGQHQQSGYANIRAFQALQRSAQSVLGAPNGSWEPTQGYGVLDIEALVTQADSRLATVGSIQGILYYNATAIANVAVKARRASTGVTYQTTSQRDGTYRFDQLPPGYYTVSAAPFGAFKARNVLVKTGCDMPGTDVWAGTYTGDTTLPNIMRAQVKTVTATTLMIDQWAYDTETGIDKVMFQVGTTPGGVQNMAPREVWRDGNAFVLYAGRSFAPGVTYHARLTFTNGAGLSKQADFTFSR